MQLQLKTWIIRSWKKEDATFVARHANIRQIWENLRDMFPHPYQLKDTEDFITKT